MTKTKVQSLILSRDSFTRDEARSWARRHGYRSAVDATPNTYRLRQRPPTAFVPGSFRTIEFAPGIEAVIGHPKKGDQVSRKVRNAKGQFVRGHAKPRRKKAGTRRRRRTTHKTTHHRRTGKHHGKRVHTIRIIVD